MQMTVFCFSTLFKQHFSFTSFTAVLTQMYNWYRCCGIGMTDFTRVEYSTDTGYWNLYQSVPTTPSDMK